LLIIALLATILSIFFSGPLFIKPKYKSYCTIYPSNLINYSNETVTEQMLQIFKSDDIRDSVIKKLYLIKHYDIDTLKPHYNTYLHREWDANVSIHKTEYESVEIEVMDIDPVIACRIINEMVTTFNLKVRSLMREKTNEVVTMLKHQLDIKKLERDTLELKLNLLRKDYNILDFNSQVKEATRGYVSPNSKNQNAANMLKSLVMKGGEYEIINDQFESASKTYLTIKIDYENALKDLTKELTYTNIINKAIPADKKCYPVRWLIVLISILSSWVLSLLIIIYIEKYKEYKSIESGKL